MTPESQLFSARDAAARVGCKAHTLRSAARRGAVEGAAKDAEGRWWFDPDGVRRWVGTLRSPGRHAAAPVRNPYWRGKGRVLTEAGFHPDAITVDPDTGCWLWGAGVTSDGHPFAWDGTKHVNVRRRLWELTHGPLAEGHWLRRRCADLRCVAPDHQELRSPTRERAPFTPPVIPPPPTAHQVRLGPLVPAVRPEGIPEREWVLLSGLVAGRTVAEMTKVIGVARQHGYVLLRRAEGRLRSSDR